MQFNFKLVRKMKTTYIHRIISKEVNRLATLYNVVTITGPRQSGKTTLCKKCFPNFEYVNLEDLSIREQVKTNPKAFLTQFQAGLIIDEVQHLPELFSYIQVLVDENPITKFILTGSSNFAIMQNVTQSLAGRTAVLTLLPLSLSELKASNKIATNTLLLNGGYPAVWGRNLPVQDASKNYYNTYIERDVRQLLKVKDISKFQIFIRLCAGRVGSEFNASVLSGEVGVSVHTIQEWLSTLEASYVVFKLPPFSKNIGKRLIKSPKIYFYDTGLACFLLGIENEEQLATHPLRGAIFENYVVLEFLKQRFNNGKLPNLYFYRDRSQKEIDILQAFGADYYAYEIKSATNFHKSFMKNLNYLKEILGNKLVSTQLVYDGELTINSTENGTVNFRDIEFME